MIPLSARRASKRTQLEAKISSQPSPARFRDKTFDVFTSEPQKTREFRLAGMEPSVELEASAALPLGSKRPEARKEPIQITDLSGETLSYQIINVTPLEGTDCYRLGLKSTREAPQRRNSFL